jgi:hypothetical protein
MTETLTAGDLSARHIGKTVVFKDGDGKSVSGELRQIYHAGDYPLGETLAYVGPHDPVEHVLAQQDSVTVTEEAAMKVTGEEFEHKVVLYLDDAPDVTAGTGLHFTRPGSAKYRPNGLVIQYRRERGKDWECWRVTAEGPIYKKDGAVSQVLGAEEWHSIDVPGGLAAAPQFIQDLVKQYAPEA